MTPEAVYRAVLIGTAAGVGTAVLLTFLAALLHSALVRNNLTHSVAALISIALSAFTFLVAGTVMMATISELVNPPRSSPPGTFSISSVYVDPGILHKLALLAAIAGTWAIAAILSRNR